MHHKKNENCCDKNYCRRGSHSSGRHARTDHIPGVDLLVYMAMQDEIRGRMGSRSGRNWIMNYPATVGNDSL